MDPWDPSSLNETKCGAMGAIIIEEDILYNLGRKIVYPWEPS